MVSAIVEITRTKPSASALLTNSNVPMDSALLTTFSATDSTIVATTPMNETAAALITCLPVSTERACLRSLHATESTIAEISRTKLTADVTKLSSNVITDSVSNAH